MLVRRHIYIELCPNNQTSGIKFNVCACQQGVLHKALTRYNTPSLDADT